MIAKKAVVIGLIGILVLSATLSAVAFYGKTPANSSQPASVAQINSQINTIVESCMNSLPAGDQACDEQLKQVVDSLCQQNNNMLDACNNGKVAEYYRMRAESTTANRNNSNSSNLPLP